MPNAFFSPQKFQWHRGEPGRPDQKHSHFAESKDSPPYLHDQRLMTLEDTVEYFNLILETKLDKQEKSDLVAFLRTL